MMCFRYFICTINLLILGVHFSYAYSTEVDSIQRFLSTHPQSDSVRMNSLLTLADKMLVFDLHKSGIAANEALTIAQLQHYPKYEALAKAYIGKYYWHKGDAENALKYGLEALKKLETMPSQTAGLAMTYKYLAFLYDQEGNKIGARGFLQKVLHLARKQKDIKRERNTYLDLAAFFQTSAPDSAQFYYQKAQKLDEQLGDVEGIAWTNYAMGNFLITQNRFDEAKILLEKACPVMERKGNNIGAAACYRSLGWLCRLTRDLDKSALYLKQSIQILNNLGAYPQLIESYEQLYFTQKEKGDLYHALESHEVLMTLKDSMGNHEKSRQVIEIQTKYEVDKKVKENEVLVANQQKQNIFLISAGVAVALLSALAFVLFQFNRVHAQNNKNLKELNQAIEQKTSEITKQKEEIRRTNENLNAMIIERNKQLAYERQLNEEIAEKNNQIVLQTQKIEQTNQHLEEIVKERTAKLQLQNERLKDYAFYNSHRIRGPLARVLGLIQAYKANYLTDPTFVFTQIDDASQEMDDVVKDINNLLAQRQEEMIKKDESNG